MNRAVHYTGKEPAAPRRQKILIVDDKKENLYALEKLLNETGAEVIKARSGNEALIASLNDQFDLAILDVQMPEMDGYELAKHLRSAEETKNLPIIFVSAVYHDENHIFRGYESGAVDFITKPYNPVIFLSKVRSFLERERLLQELQTEVGERKRAEADLLEKKAQLEVANRELESFSYSVSHDLRAPLRAIDGFSRMLLSQHSDGLDQEALRKLNVIRDNARKMGQLIDDLLEFSRLSRKSLSRSRIGLEEMVDDIWRELCALYPERKMELRKKSLPPACGDYSLIKLVLENLLSNALKFSKYRETSIVEVGGSGQGNESVFYVKDNGSGFDMRYSDKLFGVFQRLHSPDQFEGTGVGLAIVQRIILRHGGRVWAEGKVDEGAVFHFSLPIK